MKEEILVCLIIIFVGFASYGLGILSVNSAKNGEMRVLSGTSSVIQAVDRFAPDSVQRAEKSGDSQVVASKNGTKYHYPWCGGAKQISEKNKITFNTIEEARKAGYMPAGNCKGLK